MRQRCPVCGQTLPEGMDAAEIDRRLVEIGAAETDKVRHELADQYSRQLAKKRLNSATVPRRMLRQPFERRSKRFSGGSRTPSAMPGRRPTRSEINTRKRRDACRKK